MQPTYQDVYIFPIKITVCSGSCQCWWNFKRKSCHHDGL